MDWRRFETRDEWIAAAAAFLVDAAARAVQARDCFTIALSGGSTPWPVFEAVDGVDWSRWHVFQVDERAAPDGDPERNWTRVRSSLLDRVPIPASQCHPMPVLEPDRARAARDYAAALPASLDVAQLGLGEDAHTASLVPGDPLLEESTALVGWSEPYGGRRRMSLTFPALRKARECMWLIAGADRKRRACEQLRAGDTAVPAGRIARGVAFVLP